MCTTPATPSGRCRWALITDHGWKLLTAAFPRKLEDVEAWIAAARR